MTPAWIGRPFTIVDGGLSTALEHLGNPPSGRLWTAQLVIDRPDVIVQAHRCFVDAGAEVVITSSYQASVDGFVRAGLDRTEARAALASTTQLARRAGAPFVAASIGPFGAALADGSEYHGRYSATWDEVRAYHRSRIEVLADTDCDLFAIETIPTEIEAAIVVDELARATTRPAWLSVTCADERVTAGGDDIERLAALADGAGGIAAFGVNCTEPRHVETLLQRSASITSLPLVAYPNRGGTWNAERKCWLDADADGDADHLGPHVAMWVRCGARLIGGCCGVTPDGVARLVQARAALGCAT